jgi:NAD(P)-dependent dehydrogenase (short-subunit alcohol dehydrogenase family)
MPTMSSMSSHANLAGQHALITGASSGIGRAIALRLGRDAADMMVHGRDLKRGQEVVDAISAHGGQARFMLPTSAMEAVTRLAQEAGDVDTLVNNVFPGYTPDLDVETFSRAVPREKTSHARVRRPRAPAPTITPSDGHNDS